MEQSAKVDDKRYYSTFELSIRRVDQPGLPGDDTSLYNLKIGSALKGQSPLRGLDFEEERKYLPEIIGIDPKDVEWRKKTNNYWSNISAVVPADGTTTLKLQGRPLSFTLMFTNKNDKESFENTLDLEKKAEYAQKGTVVDGIGDYILFRYCLVYGRVANSRDDIFKSPKIRFYLFSKETEVKNNHAALKLRQQANKLFGTILDDAQESKVNAILLMFKENLGLYDTLADKHIHLESLASTRPKEFIKFMQDNNLSVKAFIKKAVTHGIIRQPVNTDSYYYGDNDAVCLGTNLVDAVLYCKSPDETNKQIVAAIKAQLKNM